MASISLYFGKIPTELDPEQVHDYLHYLQKKSKFYIVRYFFYFNVVTSSLPRTNALSINFIFAFGYFSYKSIKIFFVSLFRLFWNGFLKLKEVTYKRHLYYRYI